MQNTEPPIAHTPAGRGTAQQPDTGRRARRRARLRGTSLGICVMPIGGAAVSGASFVSDSRAGASMAMAVPTGAALLCYLGNLFAAPPRATAAGQGSRDD